MRSEFCMYCKKPITSENGFSWRHANGFLHCSPQAPKWEVATPPSKVTDVRDIPETPQYGTANEHPNRPVHLVPALNAGFRTACGKLTRNAVEGINQTTIKDDVTCRPCMGTLKYRTMKENVPNVSEQEAKDAAERAAESIPIHYWNVLTDTRVACGLLTPSVRRSTSILDNVTCGLCKGSDSYKLAVLSRTSETNQKLVYCVHCQQYHVPKKHVVSFDYPPIPYARQLFEERQADLRTEMQEYIEGRSGKHELDASIRRIEAEYVGGMNDLFKQGLI